MYVQYQHKLNKMQFNETVCLCMFHDDWDLSVRSLILFKFTELYELKHCRKDCICYTLRKKRVLNRTLKGSSAQRSDGTFKGSRWNPLEMVLGGTLSEEP